MYANLACQLAALTRGGWSRGMSGGVSGLTASFIGTVTCSRGSTKAALATEAAAKSRRATGGQRMGILACSGAARTGSTGDFPKSVAPREGTPGRAANVPPLIALINYARLLRALPPWENDGADGGGFCLKSLQSFQ